MSDRFAGVARGQALRGSAAIAQYVFVETAAAEIVCRLPRSEFGIVTLGRDLTGFTGWIDFARAARARGGKGRRRATSKAREVETATA
jgi:hypothetical protein